MGDYNSWKWKNRNGGGWNKPTNSEDNDKVITEKSSNTVGKFLIGGFAIYGLVSFLKTLISFFKEDEEEEEEEEEEDDEKEVDDDEKEEEDEE